MAKIKLVLFAFVLGLFVSACSSTPDFTPKPRGFNRIDLPTSEYQSFSDESLPYSFDFSKAAKVVDDKKSFKGEAQKFYKIIQYPTLGCEIYLTYKPINNNLKSLITEGYDMRDAHEKRANGMEENYESTTSGYHVAHFDIAGEVPSPYQFMVHDSLKHFIRGALYFPVAPKNDSLAPIINFVKKDVKVMLNSLKFK